MKKILMTCITAYLCSQNALIAFPCRGLRENIYMHIPSLFSYAALQLPENKGEVFLAAVKHRLPEDKGLYSEGGIQEAVQFKKTMYTTNKGKCAFVDQLWHYLIQTQKNNRDYKGPFINSEFYSGFIDEHTSENEKCRLENRTALFSLLKHLKTSCSDLFHLSGRVGSVDYLQNQLTHNDISSQKKQQALQEAVDNNELECVELLVANGAMLKNVSLYKAAENGSTKTLEYLLKNEDYSSDSHTAYAFAQAVHKKHMAICDLFYHYGVPLPVEYGKSYLVDAIKNEEFSWAFQIHSYLGTQKESFYQQVCNETFEYEWK